MTTATDRLCLTEAAATVRVGERLFVLNLDDLAAHPVPIVLEGSAPYLWQLLADGCDSRDALQTRARADFPQAAEAQLAADLEAFLGRLAEVGLLGEGAAR